MAQSKQFPQIEVGVNLNGTSMLMGMDFGVSANVNVKLSDHFRVSINGGYIPGFYHGRGPYFDGTIQILFNQEKISIYPLLGVTYTPFMIEEWSDWKDYVCLGVGIEYNISDHWFWSASLRSGYMHGYTGINYRF